MGNPGILEAWLPGNLLYLLIQSRANGAVTTEHSFWWADNPPKMYIHLSFLEWEVDYIPQVPLQISVAIWLDLDQWNWAEQPPTIYGPKNLKVWLFCVIFPLPLASCKWWQVGPGNWWQSCKLEKPRPLNYLMKESYSPTQNTHISPCE